MCPLLAACVAFHVSAAAPDGRCPHAPDRLLSVRRPIGGVAAHRLAAARSAKKRIGRLPYQRRYGRRPGRRRMSDPDSSARLRRFSDGTGRTDAFFPCVRRRPDQRYERNDRNCPKGRRHTYKPHTTPHPGQHRFERHHGSFRVARRLVRDPCRSARLENSGFCPADDTLGPLYTDAPVTPM